MLPLIEGVELIVLGYIRQITFSFYCHNKLMSTTQKTGEEIEIIGKYTLYRNIILGKGATATVFKGEVSISKEVVAIKVVDLSQHCDVAQRTLLENQCKALRGLNHQNVIHLLDIIEINQKFYLITKFYEGVTLAEYLALQTLSEQQICHVFSKVLEGIGYLIDKNILHRDLKPSNIIIDKHLNPIIIDFGFCEIIHEAKISRVFNVGSPSYMAPQAYLKTLYSQKSESWSLGMILHEMIYRKTLDKGLPIKEFYEKVRTDSNFISNQISRDLTTQLREILEKSFKYNSMQRVSITGMKYLTDLLMIKQRKQGSKRIINVPSSINFNHSRQLVKFNHQQPVDGRCVNFQTVSPLKKREVSIKFIQIQENTQNISDSQMKIGQRQQGQGSFMKERKNDNPSLKKDSANKNTDYFARKINKGVFDLKRFSKTQRDFLPPQTPHILSIKQL